MFENAFKNLDNVLRQEAGCQTELDYAEQTSWMLFLKYLDDLEEKRKDDAGLRGEDYAPIMDAEHRWSAWAAPKNADGAFDHDNALTGDDLIEFVDKELFPYLGQFRQSAEPGSIEYKIGEIFSEITNRFRSGYSLRDALETVDALDFGSDANRHELSHLYETRIKNMGNAGRNGGEYYTPRPLIRAMVKVIGPEIGETIYDPACGSCGFLCEAFEHLWDKADSTGERDTIQNATFTGKEKKSLAYVIGVMNMILHGIEAPNVLHTNTLNENLQEIQPKDRFDIILANPPFGGKERKEVQHNFSIQTGETAFLFLQHAIKRLKPRGRAAIVIKNTFLSNTDNAATALRRELLEECTLDMVLDMPQGTFTGAGVKTVVLFFTRGAPTREIFYYQLDPGRSLGKTNALTDADFEDFLARAQDLADSAQSWTAPIGDVDEATYDLSVGNPNAPEEEPLRSPEEILDEIEQLDAETAEILVRVRELV
ncbi:N-6 DNA methylase [Parasphingopyxis algicola]|uniref:class I SAM-dependent DNA methyltransferase n=1 Tax=Parasphingopyxis algicola TaxID=2026624 RepID=UPI0015A05F8D|nr:N-6 DNA methylase [Parasphingopyxis algicola]QLC24866.1 N-6 DNA methylase [Parasphingopyxis algicola]